MNLFNNIEKSAKVDMKEILKLANSLKGADFKDEKTIRNVITQVSKIANTPVSKEKEEKIIKAIKENKVPSDLGSISKMLKK
ncbi:stage VI sporulation protein F [Bacillus horti]|uniref:Ribosomal protein S18 n=1 Tax=Caldalkalibacillus horti TaxID=77523 RepID=A0ABT9VY97_9BACI|nr:stage VI sporulation protein F [Bacillus horti]MDQ0165797.1 ribosomal protein S18 [Bacillus horti]